MNRQPPASVLRAFGANTSSHDELGQEWDYGYRYGGVVVKPVADALTASASALVRESLKLPGVGVSQPVRSSDGRIIAGGFCATEYREGGRAATVDEVATIGLALEKQLSRSEALASLKRTHNQPGLMCSGQASLPFLTADRIAFADDPVNELDAALRYETPAVDAGASRVLTVVNPDDPAPDNHPTLDVETRSLVFSLCTQLAGDLEEASMLPATTMTHADILATTIIDEFGNPVVTDIVPALRPAGYTSALAIADGIIAQRVDAACCARFAFVAGLQQLVRRAALYRLCLFALHPAAKPEAGSTLIRAVDTICGS